MTINVVHSTTATAADDPAAEINKDEWNAAHTVTMATGKLLGRATDGTGAVEEIALGANLSFDGTTLDATGGGASALDDLTDVVITTPSNTQVLKYNGTNWVNASESGGTATAHPTFIAGLQLVWVSGSAINVGTGSAYVESEGDAVTVGSVINLTGISLGNDAWGYVYLLDDGNAECVTTAPAAPYAGFARSKTSANTRRFLGAVRTDGSGNIYGFNHNPVTGRITYKNANLGASPFRILNNGSATTSTSVDASGIIPPQASIAYIRFTNLNASEGFYGSDGTYTVSASAFDMTLATVSSTIADMAVSSSQTFNYLMSGSGGGMYADVYGYVALR